MLGITKQKQSQTQTRIRFPQVIASVACSSPGPFHQNLSHSNHKRQITQRRRFAANSQLHPSPQNFVTSNLLTGVDHALLALVLLPDHTAAGKLSLAVFGLLILLDDGAKTAAAREANVGDTAALKVVLAADFGTLHDQGDDGEANAGGTDKEKARGVDGLVSLEIAILVETVVSFAKGNAGQAPGNQAGVDWVVESEERIVEGLSTFRRLGVDNLTRLGEEVAKALAPTSHIPLINGTTAGGLLLRGGHDNFLEGIGNRRKWKSKSWVSI